MNNTNTTNKTFYIVNYDTEENIEIFDNYKAALNESIDGNVYKALLNPDNVYYDEEIKSWNYEDNSELFLSTPERLENSLVLLGHDIELSVGLNEKDLDNAIDQINLEILQGCEEGNIVVSDMEVEWGIVEPLTYLGERTQLLEQNDEVILEQNQRIYKINKTSEQCYRIISYICENDEIKAINDFEVNGTANDAVSEILLPF